jgi:hypothetical protein
MGLSTIPYGEVKVPEVGVRPDYAVDIAGARVGYIELKAPGSGVPPDWRVDARSRKQFARLCDLPNVLFSDGLRWSLFQEGSLSGAVQLEGEFGPGAPLRPPAGGSFEALIFDFFAWTPPRPRRLRDVIRMTAGLCRVLRDTVNELMLLERTLPDVGPFTWLAEDWRALLFPKLTDDRFADAFAQTITFGLLLAREAGVEFAGKDPREIAAQLRKHHPLLGRALHVLTHDDVVDRLKVVDTLVRVIGAVDWQALPDADRAAYWDLYEPFLEEYDSKLRQDTGAYYTPEPVAAFLTDFVDRILRTRMNRRRGFADESVIALDPAMGTGTFLVEVIRSVARTIGEEQNELAVQDHLRELYRSRLVGFERSAAPYAVAELRLFQTLQEVYGAEVPERSMRFLIDTLDDPNGRFLDRGLDYDEIQRSRDRANKIKRETPIVVVMGNPPYVDRAKQRDPAPWIEEPRPVDRPADILRRPSLDEFRTPGKGRLDYKLYSTGTYFWRWATWKVFDAHPQQPYGVVALITTSAFLAGEAFAGMRRYLRETADEGWIIDLSPEGHQSAQPTRVFRGVQQPICIGIFARSKNIDRTVPARVRYRAVKGSRGDKFNALASGVIDLDDPGWRDCSSGWTDDFLPDHMSWRSYPALGDLFPWHQTGVTPNRTWVYAPTAEALRERWRRFAASPDKDTLLKVTCDRTPDTKLGTRPALRKETTTPPIEPCAFRSFDRQFIFADPRLVDRLRPPLWNVFGPDQVYISEQHDLPVTSGPAITLSAFVPDAHCYKGRGGRVLPLFRDPGSRAVNVAPRLLQSLRSYFSHDIVAEDLLAYVGAVVAHSGYTRRFGQQLQRPGVRLPLTLDPELWDAACDVGRTVVWLHTYGECFHDVSAGRPQGPPRLPRERRPQIITRIPDGPDGMPETISYDPDRGRLHVGDGIIGPVVPDVWAYDICGTSVVKKWFGFRQGTRGRQRRSSPLDDVRAERWTTCFTDELLDLLQVLTLLVDLEPRQDELLAQIVDAPMITVDDLVRAGVLPVPAEARRAPRPPAQAELPFD